MKRIANLISFLLLGLQLLVSAQAEIREVTYLHTDGLRSPVVATDENGQVKWREQYLPYGDRQASSSANTADVGYTGHFEQADIGLTYAGARWYDPEVGRFLSLDNVRFVESNPMSFNRYAYASHNPYKYVDPDGQLSIEVNLSMSSGLTMENGRLGFGATVGSGFGFMMSVPTPWEDAELDAGFTVTRSGGSAADRGGRAKKLGLSIAKAAVGVTASKGSVLDAEGDGAYNGFTALVGGLHSTANLDGEISGIGVHGGVGLSIGSEGTVTDVYSARRGVRNMINVVERYINQKSKKMTREWDRFFQSTPPTPSL